MGNESDGQQVDQRAGQHADLRAAGLFPTHRTATS